MDKKKERRLTAMESKKFVSRILTIIYFVILLILFIQNGIDVSFSSDSFSGGSFYVYFDKNEMPIVYFLVFLPMIGYWLRLFLHKTKENEMFAIESFLGSIFLFPITIVIVMSSLIFSFGCILYLIILAISYLIFNLFRKKSITFYIKVEYILFIILLLIIIINYYTKK